MKQINKSANGFVYPHQLKYRFKEPSAYIKYLNNIHCYEERYDTVVSCLNINNSLIEMDIYGEGNSSPYDVYHQLNQRLLEELDIESMIETQREFIIEIIKLNQFMIWAVGSYSLFFLDLALQYHSLLQKKYLATFPNVKFIDSEAILKLSTKIIERLVPPCGHKRFKNYSILLSERIMKGKSIIYPEMADY